MRGCIPFSAAAVLLAVLAGCAANNICLCAPCTTAVDLTVVEAGSGLALDAFDVNVTFNGNDLGSPGECADTFRNGNNCTFGFEPGLYQMVISSPGHQPREAAVRMAAQEGAECCVSNTTGIASCLRAKLLTVALEPLQ